MAGVRLQKYLAQAGVASRRRGEDLITAGRVRVNGVVVTELGTRVAPERDVVEVDGQRVLSAATEWIAVHKPAGYLSTRMDPQGRRTLYALLPERMRALFSVGRLDRDSEGLILLTNEGDVAHRLLHPRYGIEREYDIELDRAIDDAAVRALLRGVTLEDGPARAERCRRVTTSRIVLTLREGRKREVRRMLDALGWQVVHLRRVRYGPIRLGALRPGTWRELTAREIASLQSVAGGGSSNE